MDVRMFYVESLKCISFIGDDNKNYSVYLSPFKLPETGMTRKSN